MLFYIWNEKDFLKVSPYLSCYNVSCKGEFLSYLALTQKIAFLLSQQAERLLYYIVNKLKKWRENLL